MSREAVHVDIIVRMERKQILDGLISGYTGPPGEHETPGQRLYMNLVQREVRHGRARVPAAAHDSTLPAALLPGGVPALRLGVPAEYGSIGD